MRVLGRFIERDRELPWEHVFSAFFFSIFRSERGGWTDDKVVLAPG
jgi:hypothetical protein